MNLDLILLKLFLNKTIYNKYSKIIDLDFYKNNSKEIFKLFLALFKLQDQSETDVDLSNLEVYFHTLYPLLKDDEKTLFNHIFSQINNSEVDEELAIAYLEKHNEQTVATQIALKALEVSQGKAEMGTVRELLDSIVNVQGMVTEDMFVSDDLEVLVNDEILTEGLRWRLTTMNRTVGSLRKGNFGFLFARPETGKTTFLASEVTWMAQQAKERGLGPVLWINNEEAGGTVKIRCYQAVFGVTSKELFTNLNYFNEEYSKIIGNHIKLLDRPDITKKEIEQLCEELKPSLIIFDQIDKVRWQDNERYDLKMKAIYQWARELAKKYGAVIGVCQAGGTAEGKQYLTMNDVDSSHTAKQGEADFMIGIGKTNKDGEEFMRFVAMSKNKLGKDIDCVAEMRHAKVPIIIQPEIARYSDSIDWK